MVDRDSSSMMGSDEPPFLEVDTEVSAKFRGAFCEAKIKAAKKIVKCKVLFKDNSGVAAVSHDIIDGELKLNGAVKVKYQDGDPQEATIIKMTDNSLYTVVFDDGDERTLRRTNICLKGERHFQEDETLDHLPLTDPENFGTPVLRGNSERKKRRKRLNSHNSNDDEDDDSVDDDVPLKRKYENLNSYVGKVVCVEQGERKKSWFPALCLRKDFADNGMVVRRDEILVQSFKDNKKICINKASIKEFSKEKEPLASFIRGDVKIEPILKAGIEKAVAYHDNGELPKGWTVNFSDDDDTNRSERDDDTESIDEETIFLSKLYKFMEDQGTPIMKTPYLGNQEVNLYKLYQLVMNLNGMEEVSNQSKWRTVYSQLGIPTLPTTASYNIKNLYKKYLFQYEEFTRKAYEEEKKRREELLALAREDTERSKRRLTRPRGRRSSVDSVERMSKRLRDGLDTSKGGDMDYKAASDADIDEEYTKSHDIDDLVDVVNSPQSSGLSEDSRDFFDFKGDGEGDGRYIVNTRVLVKYGKGRNQRTYEAKIVDIDSEIKDDVMYYVHYTGWNTRYDEWVKLERIAGLSTNPPTRKRGQSSAPLKSIKEREKEKESPPAKKVETYTPVTPVASPSPAKSVSRQSSRRSPIHHTSEKAKSPFPNHLTDPSAVDAKASPNKPRMTRNSMQDTFLLTAIEESIAGKTRSVSKGRNFGTQSSAESNGESNGSHSSESSLGSENGSRKPKRSGRRRLGRPPKPDANSDSDSGKEDNSVTKKAPLASKETDEEEDFGDEDEDDEQGKQKQESPEKSVEVEQEQVSDLCDAEASFQSPAALEDSTDMDACKTKDGRPSRTAKTESGKTLKSEPRSESRFPNTRNGKTRSSMRCAKRRNNGDEIEMDSPSEMLVNRPLNSAKESSAVSALATEQLGKMEAAENLLSVSLGHLTDIKPPVNLTTDVSYSEVSQERLRKENAATMKPPDLKEERPASQNSCIEKERRRKRREKKHRRKRTASASLSAAALANGDLESGESLQSPLRTSTERYFSRFYDGQRVDFVSDLPVEGLDSNGRITLILERMQEVRRLYAKMKGEVASIDRRRRRKMRKQMEGASSRRDDGSADSR